MRELGSDQFVREVVLQPKLEIADYVAQHGFNAPEHYQSIDGAFDLLMRQIPVIARSEHPDEYNGPSGLGRSRIIMPTPDAAARLAHIVANPLYDSMEKYATSAGLDTSAYTLEASTSYWEYIRGTNVTIVADDTVAGRYHMFGAGYSDEDFGPINTTSGAVVDGSGTVLVDAKNNEGDALAKLPRKEIIDMYEEIRNLPKFDANHCPIMEMQVSNQDQEIYFLQYHRSRDQQLSEPSLDPRDFDPRDLWLPAEHVRGQYLGRNALKLVLAYGSDSTDSTNSVVETSSDGFYGESKKWEEIGEIAARQSLADITPRKFDHIYTDIATSHAQRSRMFKPQVSLLVAPHHALKAVSNKVIREAHTSSKADKMNVGIEVEVVSDGHTGYVRPHSDLIAI